MKRLISTALSMAMILSLCACNTNNQAEAPTESEAESVQPLEPTKSLEAVRVDRMIESIGKVTLDSESKIIQAERAVKALSDEDYSQLEQLQVLKDARATFDELQDSVLDGYDKIAFDLIMYHAYSFHDPSSIRLRSGVAAEIDEYGATAFLCISAKNGFGAIATDDILLTYDMMETVPFDSDAIEKCRTTDWLNVDKINRALQRELG